MSNRLKSYAPYKSWAKYFEENSERLLGIENVSRLETRRFKVNEKLNEKVALVQGDITKLKVDAVVNAANQGLRGGGGVDGAIHKAAGYQKLQNETRKLYPDGCSPGNAVITQGFNLPAKNIIHTVGPMDGSDETLMSCYHNCLKLCVQKGLRSIAFCCIATGVYGFPNDRAAQIAVACSRAVLEKYGDKFDQIVFCVFLPVDHKYYEEFLSLYFPVEEEKGEDSDDRENEEEASFYEIIEERLIKGDEWQEQTDVEDDVEEVQNENEKEQTENDEPLGERPCTLGAASSPKAPKQYNRPTPTGEESQESENVTQPPNQSSEMEELRSAPDGEAASEQQVNVVQAASASMTGNQVCLEGGNEEVEMESQPNSPKRMKEETVKGQDAI